MLFQSSEAVGLEALASNCGELLASFYSRCADAGFIVEVAERICRKIRYLAAFPELRYTEHSLGYTEEATVVADNVAEQETERSLLRFLVGE